MSVDFSQIIDIDIVLVSSVIFLEDCCNLLFILIKIWFSSHSFHELIKTYTTCFFQIELGDDLINGFLVWIEAILVEEEGQIIRQKNTHTSGIISIKNFFEVNNILNFKLPSNIELRFKMLQIFSFESNSIHILISIRSSLTFFRTISKLIIFVLFWSFSIDEGSSSLLILGAHGLVLQNIQQIQLKQQNLNQQTYSTKLFQFGYAKYKRDLNIIEYNNSSLYVQEWTSELIFFLQGTQFLLNLGNFFLVHDDIFWILFLYILPQLLLYFQLLGQALHCT